MDSGVIALLLSGLSAFIAVATFLRGKSKVEELKDYVIDEFKSIRQEASDGRHDLVDHRIMPVFSEIKQDLQRLTERFDRKFNGK